MSETLPSPPPVAPAGRRTVLVEPDGVHGTFLTSAIDGAASSVHMTMFLLTSRDVLGALIRASDRGLDVRVVLNQHFPPGCPVDNTVGYHTLVGAKVKVVWAPKRFSYTHEKCVILDRKVAWIMTMNATNSSPDGSREFIVVDEDPIEVAEAESIFAADFAGEAIVPSGPLVVAPVNAREKILALIQGAKKTLDVEGEELSDLDVARAIAERAHAGVKTRVVLANKSGNAPSVNPALAILKTSGAALYVSGAASSSHSRAVGPYIHAKAIVADESFAYVGSVNFSHGSMTRNRELGVLLTESAEIAKVSAAIAADAARGSCLS